MGPLSRLTLTRDKRGTLQRIDCENIFFPEEIHSQLSFDLMGRIATKKEYACGIEKQVEFSSEGKPITETIDLFGEAKLVYNYNPLTGEYLGCLMEAKDE